MEFSAGGRNFEFDQRSIFWTGATSFVVPKDGLHVERVSNNDEWAAQFTRVENPPVDVVFHIRPGTELYQELEQLKPRPEYRVRWKLVDDKPVFDLLPLSEMAQLLPIVKGAELTQNDRTWLRAGPTKLISPAYTAELSIGLTDGVIGIDFVHCDSLTKSISYLWALVEIERWQQLRDWAADADTDNWDDDEEHQMDPAYWLINTYNDLRHIVRDHPVPETLDLACRTPCANHSIHLSRSDLVPVGEDGFVSVSRPISLTRSYNDVRIMVGELSHEPTTSMLVLQWPVSILATELLEGVPIPEVMVSVSDDEETAVLQKIKYGKSKVSNKFKKLVARATGREMKLKGAGYSLTYQEGGTKVEVYLGNYYPGYKSATLWVTVTCDDVDEVSAVGVRVKNVNS